MVRSTVKKIAAGRKYTYLVHDIPSTWNNEPTGAADVIL
jgi:hypothetical protein